MESNLVQLEQSVEKADGTLDVIAYQIDALEEDIQDTDKEVSVVRLLRTVTKVKEEYSVLRQDILEVHQLQKQLADSLRAQLNQVQGHYAILRDKIIGKSGFPRLK